VRAVVYESHGQVDDSWHIFKFEQLCDRILLYHLVVRYTRTSHIHIHVFRCHPAGGIPHHNFFGSKRGSCFSHIIQRSACSQCPWVIVDVIFRGGPEPENLYWYVCMVNPIYSMPLGPPIRTTSYLYPLGTILQADSYFVGQQENPPCLTDGTEQDRSSRPIKDIQPSFFVFFRTFAQCL
jgi:hypothetical protein